MTQLYYPSNPHIITVLFPDGDILMQRVETLADAARVARVLGKILFPHLRLTLGADHPSFRIERNGYSLEVKPTDDTILD